MSRNLSGDATLEGLLNDILFSMSADDALRRRPDQPGSLADRPLPRMLGGRTHGRVSPSLRLALAKVRLLRHVSTLDVEDPVLDALDERTLEFVLDAQAALLRVPCGAVHALSLLPFERVCPGEGVQRFGTPARRTKWAARRSMPWRVMDYAKSAERMLERRRAADRVFALRRG